MTIAVTMPNDLRKNLPFLEGCCEGDPAAVTRLLKLLGHPTPELRHAYQDAIRQANQEKLWRGLVSVLADRHWEVVLNHPVQIQLIPDQEHQLRIDEAILDLLTQDQFPVETRPKMAALHNCLLSDSIQQRYIASYLLVSHGEHAAIANLEQWFAFTTLEWQLRTVRLLASLETPTAGPLLVKALSSTNRVLHHQANRALKALGLHATDAWISALEHPNSHIRWHAARGLGELGDVRAMNILVAGLRDENSAVRCATANLLARMGSRAVPAILEEIIRKPLDEPTRQATFHALRGMSGGMLRRGLAPMIDALHGFGADLLAPQVAQKLLSQWEEYEKQAPSTGSKSSGVSVKTKRR